jgi:hypothetical protein
LKQHLQKAAQGHFNNVNDLNITNAGIASLSDFAYERKTTLLWREYEANQKSFGHALINEASPMFLVLQEHLGLKVPTQLQLLVRDGLIRCFIVCWLEQLPAVCNAFPTNWPHCRQQLLAFASVSSSLGMGVTSRPTVPP